MDAEVSYRLKYGCLGRVRLAHRLMVNFSETTSVVRSTAELLFLPLLQRCWDY